MALIVPLAGCVGAALPAGEPVLRAQAETSAAPPAPLHDKHAYDAPPVGETEVKTPFQVPNGTARLALHVLWSSTSGAAATLPKGAVVKLKDPSGKLVAESDVGPGHLPAAFEKAIDAPAAGKWIVEYEGYAPGVTATVDLAAA